MKLGISSYSLCTLIRDEKMTIFDVMDWAKDHECEHIEFVPFFVPFVDEENGTINTELIDQIKEHAAKIDLEISTFSVNADLLMKDAEKRRAEIERIKLYIQAAARLGTHWMRHDIASFVRPFEESTFKDFDEELPLMIEGVQELCDYAASFGINTTLENHGFFCNGSDRVLRILDAANRPNMKMTLDVGNFNCVDESSLGAVKKCLPMAQIIHMKDFHIRTANQFPTADISKYGSWIPTVGGQFLRGSITGQGDLPIAEIIELIKNSDFDGYISIEFEGDETPELGASASLEMVRGYLKKA